MVNQFDKNMAIFLADCCCKTYEKTPPIPSGYKLVGNFKGGWFGHEHSGFVIESEDPNGNIIVAFRGSATAEDWVDDAKTDQKRYPFLDGKCYTHVGFSEHYLASRLQILDLLKNLSKTKKLYFTGHSLGGALAVLASIDMALLSAPTSEYKYKHDKIAMYNFGAPRVGDKNFASKYNELVAESFRVSNNNDVVAHIPPEMWADLERKKVIYYQHVNHEFPLDFNYNEDIAPNHDMHNYLKALKEIPAESELSLVKA